MRPSSNATASALAPAIALVLALGVAGCRTGETGQETGAGRVDAARLERVTELPFFADGSVSPATGSTSADAAFRRGSVLVDLEVPAPSTGSALERRTASALAAREAAARATRILADGGWTIGHVSCLSVADTDAAGGRSADSLSGEQRAAYVAGTPVVVQGWRELGSGEEEFTAYLEVRAADGRATAVVTVPFHTEDARPVEVPDQAVPLADTCLDDPWTGERTEETGTPAALDRLGPASP